MAELKISSLAAHRTVDEATVVEILLNQGWPFEVRTAGRAVAETQAKAALDRFVDLGLPFAEADGRRFDPAEVSNFVEWAGLAAGDRTWRAHCVESGRQLVWEAHGGGRGLAPLPEALTDQAYRFTLRRTFNLADRAIGERVRLRLPLPIEDGGLTDLRLEFLPPDGTDLRPDIAPARLDIQLPAPEDGLLTLGVRATFTARPHRPGAGVPPLDPAEADLYLRRNEGLIKVGERVQALADRLTGGETDPLAMVRRFWDFLMDDLACGAIHHHALSPTAPLDTVLDQGWYDCQAGSALMAALCRAKGVPARLVSGYMLYATAPGFHTWFEVWLEDRGWTPFDLLSWDLSAGGRDAGWRDYFFGQLDHRVAVQRPPRLFNGAGAVRLPPAWHILTTPSARGSEIAFLSADTGALVYSDTVEVERLG
jgi:hypothetical protein